MNWTTIPATITSLLTDIEANKHIALKFEMGFGVSESKYAL